MTTTQIPVEWTGRLTVSGADEPQNIPILPAASAQPDHSARKHHKYGMSKLNAYAACAGYESQEGTNKAAEDGTRLHEILDKAVTERFLVQERGVLRRSVGETLQALLHDGTILADEDDLSLLEFCAREVDRYLPHAEEVHNEIRVEILKPDGSPLNFGSLDLLLPFRSGKAALIDYKFGWLPVPPAKENLQGKGYALACLQKFSRLDEITVIFLQPRLGSVSSATFHRREIPALYEEISQVIAKAQAPGKTLRPNAYCDFCAHAGTCTALVKSASQAVAKYESVELPDIFDGFQITTAEQAVAALYVVERLEGLIERGGVRAKALEFAKAAGGVLTVLVGNQNVTVSVHQRKMARSANSPALIAEALREHLDAGQVLACCDISITKLDEAFAESYTERAAKEADAVIEASKNLTPAERKAELARAKELRVTKKAAKAILNDVLLSEGLVTAPEGYTEYIKVRVDKQPTTQIKELEVTKENG